MPILIPAPGAVIGAVASWEGFKVLWHGADGSEWDFTDPDGGVVMTADGVKGLGMPTFDRWTTTSPSLPGNRYRGSRTQARSVLWPMFIWGSSGTDQFLARDRDFFRSLRPDVAGVWELIAPDGQSRRLRCFFVDDNNKTYTLDPAQYGWSVYAVNMVADDQPYWYGPDIAAEFGVPANVAFYSGPGGVITISPGGTTASAFLTNPGDVDAWPIWTVKNAHSGAELAVGSGSVILPAMSHGDVWTIDTRPDRQTAKDASGVDHVAAVTWNPSPAPRGESVPLAISLTGPAADVTVGVAITPLYFRGI